MLWPWAAMLIFSIQWPQTWTVPLLHWQLYRHYLLHQRGPQSIYSHCQFVSSCSLIYLRNLRYFFSIFGYQSFYRRWQFMLYWGSIIVWQFGGLSQFWVPVCGLFHIYLAVYRAVGGNYKFSSRFLVFACLCGSYSKRVKRLRRLSGNSLLLKASLFNKGLPIGARPSQSGLPSVSPAEVS